jgi:hypothetical protein
LLIDFAFSQIAPPGKIAKSATDCARPVVFLIEMKTQPCRFLPLLRVCCLAAVLAAPYALAEGAPPQPQPTAEDYNGPLLPEFNFTAHGQGPLAQLCRELEAKAGPKTHIYLSEDARKLVIPDMALKNVHVWDVLLAVCSVDPKLDIDRSGRSDGDGISAFDYWVSLKAPPSMIICHLYRLPDLPLDTGGGKDAVEKRQRALEETFDTIYTEADDTVKQLVSDRRNMANEAAPSARLTMHFHPGTRLIVASSTAENLELVGVIVKVLGGEDVGPANTPSAAQAPVAAPARNATERKAPGRSLTVSPAGLTPVAPQIVEPANPSPQSDPAKPGSVAPEAKNLPK